MRVSVMRRVRRPKSNAAPLVSAGGGSEGIADGERVGDELVVEGRIAAELVGIYYRSVESDLIQEDLRPEETEGSDVGAELARVDEGVAALVLHEDPPHGDLVEEVDVEVVDLDVRPAEYVFDEGASPVPGPSSGRRESGSPP